MGRPRPGAAVGVAAAMTEGNSLSDCPLQAFMNDCFDDVCGLPAFPDGDQVPKSAAKLEVTRQLRYASFLTNFGKAATKSATLFTTFIGSVRGISVPRARRSSAGYRGRYACVSPSIPKCVAKISQDCVGGSGGSDRREDTPASCRGYPPPTTPRRKGEDRPWLHLPWLSQAHGLRLPSS